MDGLFECFKFSSLEFSLLEFSSFQSFVIVMFLYYLCITNSNNTLLSLC